MPDLQQWARETAPTLTDDDWPKLQAHVAFVGPGPSGLMLSLSVGTFRIDECRALLTRPPTEGSAAVPGSDLDRLYSMLRVIGLNPKIKGPEVWGFVDEVGKWCQMLVPSILSCDGGGFRDPLEAAFDDKGDLLDISAADIGAGSPKMMELLRRSEERKRVARKQKDVDSDD